MEIRTIDSFLQYFKNVRERTMRVARCIPLDRWIGAMRRENSRWAICSGTSR
jgi:hypothetical protein